MASGQRILEEIYHRVGITQPVAVRAGYYHRTSSTSCHHTYREHEGEGRFMECDRGFWGLLVRHHSPDSGPFCLARLARFSTTTQWQLMPKNCLQQHPGLSNATRNATMPARAANA